MKYDTIAKITLVFTILISNTYGQKKEIEILNENIKDLFKQNQILYELQKTNKGLYLGNLSWIYLQSHTESKEDLRKLIFISYPKLQDQTKAIFPNKESVDSISLMLGNIIHLTNQNMARLNSFESYEDNAILNESQEIFDNKISSYFHSTDKLLNKELDEVNTKIRAALNTVSALNGKRTDKINQDGIISNYETVNSLKSAESISWEIFTGTVNWVYRQYDNQAKIRLKKSIENNFSPSITKNGSSINSELNPFGIISADSLALMLNKLKISSQYITDSLINSNSPNALNKLLAEDKIEVDMYYPYRDLTHFVNALISISIRNINYQLLSKDGDKIEDIKIMLNHNFNSIQSTIDDLLIKNGKSKTYKEFDRDELITKLVPIYDEKFTHQEIKEIISFQKSKVGKKLNSHSVTLFVETSVILKNYLQELDNRRQIIKGD